MFYTANPSTVQPFIHLFRMDNMRLLTVLDIEDAILMVPEIINVIIKDRGDVNLTPEVSTDIIQTLVGTLFNHFRVEPTSKFAYNLELRAIVASVIAVLDVYDGEVLSQMNDDGIFNCLRADMLIAYMDIAPNDDVNLNSQDRRALSKLAPSYIMRATNRLKHTNDDGINQMINNAVDTYIVN